MGKAALLTVAQTGKYGAFLDWGLEKDLLLPFRSQPAVLKNLYNPGLHIHSRLRFPVQLPFGDQSGILTVPFWTGDWKRICFFPSGNKGGESSREIRCLCPCILTRA